MKINYSVSIICFDDLGQIAMVREVKENSPSAPGQRLEFDGLPGGKIEPGQSVEQAVIDEMLQETGCELTGPFETLYTVEKNNLADKFTSYTSVVLVKYPGIFDLNSEDPDKNVQKAFTASLPEAVFLLKDHPELSKREPAMQFLDKNHFDKHYVYNTCTQTGKQYLVKTQPTIWQQKPAA